MALERVAVETRIESLVSRHIARGIEWTPCTLSALEFDCCFMHPKQTRMPVLALAAIVAGVCEAMSPWHF